jgi:hypothetical protein
VGTLGKLVFEIVIDKDVGCLPLLQNSLSCLPAKALVKSGDCESGCLGRWGEGRIRVTRVAGADWEVCRTWIHKIPKPRRARLTGNGHTKHTAAPYMGLYSSFPSASSCRNASAWKAEQMSLDCCCGKLCLVPVWAVGHRLGKRINLWVYGHHIRIQVQVKDTQL